MTGMGQQKKTLTIVTSQLAVSLLSTPYKHIYGILNDYELSIRWNGELPTYIQRKNNI